MIEIIKFVQQSVECHFLHAEDQYRIPCLDFSLFANQLSTRFLTSNLQNWHLFLVSLLILQFRSLEHSSIGRLLLTVRLEIIIHFNLYFIKFCFKIDKGQQNIKINLKIGYLSHIYVQI